MRGRTTHGLTRRGRRARQGPTNLPDEALDIRGLNYKKDRAPPLKQACFDPAPMHCTGPCTSTCHVWNRHKAGPSAFV